MWVTAKPISLYSDGQALWQVCTAATWGGDTVTVGRKHEVAWNASAPPTGCFPFYFFSYFSFLPLLSIPSLVMLYFLRCSGTTYSRFPSCLSSYSFPCFLIGSSFWPAPELCSPPLLKSHLVIPEVRFHPFLYLQFLDMCSWHILDIQYRFL